VPRKVEVFVSRQFPRIGSSSIGLRAAVVLVACATFTCDRGLDASRSLVAARRGGWERNLTTLQQQHAALQHRFNGATQSPGAAALNAQMRATLEGTRQSLADIAVQIAQVDRRFDDAVAHGEAPSQVAERECARLDGYFQTMSEQLTEAGQQLDRFEQSETRSATR
jgi:hypothetical protein